MAATSSNNTKKVVVASRIKSAATAVDSCEFIVHYLVRWAILKHKQDYGRLPKLVHLPKSMEAAIEIDLARSDDTHIKLREGKNAKDILECQVAWDADGFRLDP